MMTKLLMLSAAILAFCALPATVFAQPVAQIVVEDWSPWELQLAGRTTPPSTGLSVVGKGELVYLLGRETGGAAVTSYTWSIASRPTGSTAALDSTDKARSTFRPDLVGNYEIQLDITTASGNSTVSKTITAAEYVGVGIVGGQSPNFMLGQCAGCHAGTAGTWMETGHATFFQHQIDGGDDPATSHYNENCISCHTVGWDTTAVNGGFDDAAEAEGWTFPATLVPGNWADMVANYPATVAKANIQCESCHGPGSLHKGTGPTELTLNEGMCGRCHEDGHYHRRNTMWKTSGHAIGTSFARGSSFSCASCHSGWGFIAAVDPASNLAQTTGNQNITCAVCHDPHSGEAGEHQIRDQASVTLGDGSVITKGGKGQLCMNCHIGRRDAIEYAQTVQGHFGPHHSNQADMLFGTNVITWGMVVPNSTHKDALANTCVDCHMFATPAEGVAGHDLIGDHTFAMNAEVNGTVVENVASCVRCHGELTEYNDLKVTEDYDGDGSIEGYQDELDGQIEKVAMLLPPVGSPDVQADPDDSFDRIQLNALFNYHYINDDGSHGAHNFRFAMGLMKLTEAALTYGVLTEGDILAITDVPNDQGKQVRVVWTRFGGDGVSDNPVRNYAVWRQVDAAINGTAVKTAAAGKALTTLNVSSEEVAALGIGSRLDLNGELWDFAGSVPASMLDEYGAIVPTLFDSTSAGLRTSTFRVSGHTNVTAIYAVTEPANGYSVDNLAPLAPANFTLSQSDAGVALAWDEPVDEDFKAFAVYRSLTMGFDPGTLEPIAQLTANNYVDGDVQVDQSYFYRVASMDFSGNVALSDEQMLRVTSVVSTENQIPDVYSLGQNYPNPFNPTTTIEFGLIEPGHVELIIYNGLGDKVMTLVNDNMTAGTHKVTVQAGNLPTGLYFYRIRANHFTSVKKMLLVK
jgi:hypothetical protein